MCKKILTVVGITILFLGTFITPSIAIDNIKNRSIPVSSGNTLYVGGTGEGNYTKIQDAINDASDGDIVFVYNGTYYENIVINKTINLIGEDKNTTVIDGGGSGDVVFVNADCVNLSRFTIQRSGNSVDAGIEINSDYITIKNNIISSNDASIRIYSNSNYNTIIDNKISSNYAWGIHLYYTSKNTIINNNISDNRWGIELDGSDNNTIIGNMIISNKYIGIHGLGSNNNIVGNIIKSNNDKGISLRSSYKNIITNNIISGSNYGLILSDSSRFNIINSNNISNNYNGIFISGYWFSFIILRMRGRSIGNIIIKNNFLNNGGHDAFFENSRVNIWKENYWNEPRLYPKFISGYLYLMRFKHFPYTFEEYYFPCIPQIDWHPAKEPYDI